MKIRLTDEILFNRIDLERLSVWEQQKLTEALNLALSRSIGKLATQDLTAWNRERLSAWIKDVQASLDDAAGTIRDELVKDNMELGQMLLDHIPGMLNKGCGGVEVFHRIQFTPERIKAMLNSGLESRGMQNMFAKFKQHTRERFENYITATWDKGISMGLQGFSLDEMVRSLKDVAGPFGMAKREVKLLSHYLIMNTGNESYDAIYQANKDVIACLEVCVKMHDRQCNDCAALENKRYGLDFQPLDGAPPLPNGGPPQYHPFCRCVMVPVTKGYDELASKAGPLPKRARGQLANLSTETKQAWDERVDTPQGYVEWIESLSDAEQLEVLGAPRYRLFKKGVLKAKRDFIHQQRRGLSLEDLKKKWSK